MDCQVNSNINNQIFEIGKKIPNWDILRIGTNNVPKTNDFEKKPLVVLFFSLSCPGCLGRAIPFANRIVYENGDSINVVGIHTHFEGPETTDEKLLAAKEEFYIRFPYYRDAGFASTFYKYKAGGTPHWVVVDENGIVVESLFGSDPNRALLRLDYILSELKENNKI